MTRQHGADPEPQMRTLSFISGGLQTFTAIAHDQGVGRS